MNPLKMTKKQKDRFFQRLYVVCRNKRIYSLKKVLDDAGIDRDQVIEWATSNARWYEILDTCRSACASHAECAGLMMRMSSKDSMRLIYENKYVFPQHAPKVIMHP